MYELSKIPIEPTSDQCPRCDGELEWINTVTLDDIEHLPHDEFFAIGRFIDASEIPPEIVYVDVLRCTQCHKRHAAINHPMWFDDDGTYYQIINPAAPKPGQLALPIVEV